MERWIGGMQSNAVLLLCGKRCSGDGVVGYSHSVIAVTTMMIEMENFKHGW